MALSRREMNIARRGRRGRRGHVGLHSNAAFTQPGQPCGDAGEHGSVLAGRVADTGMREFERPRRNTMSRRMMSGFNPGTSAGYSYRPAQAQDELWGTGGVHRKSEPRQSKPVKAREFTGPETIRMGEFD